MKKSLLRFTMIIPLVFLLCFTFSCKQGEEPTIEETEEEDTSGTVNIDGFELPYFIEGTGIPCVVTCDALPQSRALSQGLRKHFKFVFLEPRVGIRYDKPVKYDNITMDTIVEDIDKVRRALGIDEIAVLGHSACGLFAIEYARKYPEHTSHVIMIGTPPYWNAGAIEVGKEYWEANASDERKMILKRNRDKLNKEALSGLSSSEVQIMRYIANGPLYWYDPTYDCLWLIEGYYWNVEGWNHFLNIIMAEYDITRGNQITTPVFLALGRHDYVVPYVLWDDQTEKLSNLSYNLFEKSGHYPMLEEQELFDKKLIDWIKSH